MFDLLNYFKGNTNKEISKSPWGVISISTWSIEKIGKKFQNKVASVRSYKTPPIPGKIIVKATKKDKIVNKNLYRLFRSWVGMLLYLFKYPRPDIAKLVREIAKVMAGLTKQQMKSLFRIIKYALDTENLRLVMSPKSKSGNWIEDGCLL